jgi:hypothetical protein
MAPNLATDFTDLVVSESTSPARFSQDRAILGRLADGGWVAVWNDSRLGSKKIYGSQFDSLGLPSGPNVMMAGSNRGADYVDPVLKVDTLGRVYLFYRDQTNGLIYGSRYATDLSLVSGPFLVNDTSLESFAGPFDLDIYPDGRAVVVWENYSPVGATIEMRIYASSGVDVLDPTTANGNPNSVHYWVPRIAVQPGGGYLITWEDYRNGRADIFARLFDGNGSALGGDFAVVPPPNNAFDQYSPEVEYTAGHSYVIGWIDHRSGQEIYLQKYNPTIGLVGANRRITSPDDQTVSLDLSLAFCTDSTMLAAWASFGAQSEILHVMLDTNLQLIGLPHSASTGATGRRWGPSMSCHQAGRYGVIWTEFHDDDADIHLRLFDSGGTPLLTEQRVNDDTKGAPSTDPCIVSFADKLFLIAYEDQRNDAGDIYLRAISNTGVHQSASRRANQDLGLNLQSEPALAASPDQALIVWLDGRPVGGVSGQHVFGRFSSVAGVLDGNEFMISDSGQIAVKSEPKAALATTGICLVAWIDRRDGSPQVYGQWLTAAGEPDGSGFVISDAGSHLANSDLHVARDGSNRFYVVWIDHGATVPTVRGKWFMANKVEGGTFNWVSSVPGVEIEDMSVTVNDPGEVSILLNGATGGVRKLFLVIMDRNGVIQTEPFEVLDDPSADATEPSLAIGEHGYYSAVWVDRRDGSRKVYYQLFADDLSPIGGNLAASSAAVEFMQSPATWAYRGHAWFVWVDPRQDGLNVYAANTFYLPTDVAGNDDPSIPMQYHLGQNYPNPFNPATVITFSLPLPAEVSLAVYNLLGRNVAILAEGTWPAGEYQVEWDGTDGYGRRVASGVYLYRLEAGDFSLQRKMVLLK